MQYTLYDVEAVPLTELTLKDSTSESKQGVMHFFTNSVCGAQRTDEPVPIAHDGTPHASLSGREVSPVQLDRVARLQLVQYLYAKNRLSGCSRAAYHCTSFSSLYCLPEEDLVGRLRSTYTDFKIQVGDLRRLDAILALCATEDAYTCLEEEGQLYGYRPVHTNTIPQEVLLIILHNVNNYDVLVPFYKTNKYIRSYMQSHVPELALTYSKNTSFLREPTDEEPKCIAELFAWIRKFFYTKHCHKHYSTHVCARLFLVHGDLDFFLQQENTSSNLGLPRRAKMIVQLCTSEEILHLVQTLVVDVRAEVIFYIGKSKLGDKQRFSLLKRLVKDQPLAIVERAFCALLFWPRLTAQMERFVRTTLACYPDFQACALQSSLIDYYTDLLETLDLSAEKYTWLAYRKKYDWF